MANILICNAQTGDVITQFPSTELENFIKSRKKDEVFEIQIQETNFEPIAIGDYVILHDNVVIPPTDKDKFGIPFFHKSKPNGYFLEQQNDPTNQSGFDHIDSDFTVDSVNGIITMHPNGPTSFGVGRNIRDFTDCIGGCEMNFKDCVTRGYTFKPDDVRDLEFKCLMKVNNIGGHGISISCCTGHHDSSSAVCCQGFAYMFNIEDTGKGPVPFRFRKEQYHVDYATSPEGLFTHQLANQAVDGKWVGIGVCRYNKGDHVVLEGWFNPNPEQDIKNWVMIKKIEDFNGKGWGNTCDKCGGAPDQVGLWSGPQNRLKTNATSGTVDFKCISFREIVE